MRMSYCRVRQCIPAGSGEVASRQVDLSAWGAMIVMAAGWHVQRSTSLLLFRSCGKVVYDEVLGSPRQTTRRGLSACMTDMPASVRRARADIGRIRSCLCSPNANANASACLPKRAGRGHVVGEVRSPEGRWRQPSHRLAIARTCNWSA